MTATSSLAASSGYSAASGRRDVSRYPRRSYHSRTRDRWGWSGWDSKTSSCIAPFPAAAASSSTNRTSAPPNPRPRTAGSTPRTPNQPVRPSRARARTEPTTAPSRSATAVSRRDIDVRTSAMSVRSILVAKSPTSACAYARFTTSVTAGASATSSATSGSSHRTTTTSRSYRDIVTWMPWCRPVLRLVRASTGVHQRDLPPHEIEPLPGTSPSGRLSR